MDMKVEHRTGSNLAPETTDLPMEQEGKSAQGAVPQDLSLSGGAFTTYYTWRANGVHTSVNFINAKVKATGDGEELHPDIRRGAKPEFEGDVNPKTGEVGGPKNDPLRWGGDWSYNGRVTDF